MKAVKGAFARKLANRSSQQPAAPAAPVPFESPPQPPQAWDATRFRVLLKMAKNRIDLQRGKKHNEIESTRIIIAEHLRAHKETLARIQTERVLRELSHVIAFDVIETYVQLLQTQNSILSVQKQFDVAPQDLKENVASVVFASSRLNIPELQQVCAMLRAHFGPAVIDPLLTLNGPNIKYINKTLAINLEGNTPDGYLVLEELAAIATHHQINWIPPPEEIHLDQGTGSRPSDPGYYRPQRLPDGSQMSGASFASAPPPPPMNIPGHSPYGSMPYGAQASAPPPELLHPSAPPPDMPNPSAPPFDPTAGVSGTLYPYPGSGADGQAGGYFPPPPPVSQRHDRNNNNDSNNGGILPPPPPPPPASSFLNDDALEARFRNLRK